MGTVRTILALSVVLFHCGISTFVGGERAVQLFYVVSGFLISYILNSSPRYNNVGRFYANRCLRLYPIYYAVALLSLAGWFAASHKHFGFYAELPTSAVVLLVLSNALIFGQDWVMFCGIDHGRLVPTLDFRSSEVLLYKGLLIPQAWTLGLELTFYVIAPFLLRNGRAVLAVFACAVLVKAALIWNGIGLKDPWSYRFFPAELSFFLLGAISQRYLLPRTQALCHRIGLLPHVATLLLVVCCCTYASIPVQEWIKATFLFAAFFLALPLIFEFQN